MNTTAHPVAPEEVMALLDGELSAAEAQVVAMHLDRCPECSTLAEQFRGTSQSLSRWHVEAVPEKLKNSVVDAAAKAGSRIEAGKANTFVLPSFWTRRRWAIASAGALAALLLVSAISLPSLHRSWQAATPPSAFLRKRQAETTDFIAAPAELAEQKSKAPGVAVASNGSFHGSGDQVANSFSANALPVKDQQDKVNPGPMIARTVSLSIVVKDFAAARSSLDGMLARRHGYSAQLNVSTPENAPRGLRASLRIPAPELALAIADLKTLGRVENESQSGEEVTEEHADLLARLKNSRETEQRLRTILQERTGKIADVLQVEQEIARVRGEIEGMEAEQKALEHRVDFATVDLQLTEEYKAQLNPPAASVSTRIHNAFVAGYRDASETILGIVLFFAEDGPTLLIWLLILALPVILLWRRYQRALATP